MISCPDEFGVLEAVMTDVHGEDKKRLPLCSGFVEGDMAERPWALHHALLDTISAHDAKFDCHVTSTTCNWSGYTPIIHGPRWQQHVS